MAWCRRDEDVGEAYVSQTEICVADRNMSSEMSSPKGIRSVRPMSQTMRRLKLETETGYMSVCYWKGPAGAPVLHWAHANGFNGRTYAPLLAPLAEHFHIYASDARGHGLSTLPA